MKRMEEQTTEMRTSKAITHRRRLHWFRHHPRVLRLPPTFFHLRPAARLILRSICASTRLLSPLRSLIPITSGLGKFSPSRTRLHPTFPPSLFRILKTPFFQVDHVTSETDEAPPMQRIGRAETRGEAVLAKHLLNILRPARHPRGGFTCLSADKDTKLSAA